MKKIQYLVLSMIFLLGVVSCKEQKSLSKDGSVEYMETLAVFQAFDEDVTNATNCDDMDSTMYRLVERTQVFMKEYTLDEAMSPSEDKKLLKYYDGAIRVYSSFTKAVGSYLKITLKTLVFSLLCSRADGAKWAAK